MIILGVDPGLQVCGYAAVEANSSGEKLIEAGVIRTDESAGLAKRLNQIAGDTRLLLEKFGPDVVWKSSGRMLLPLKNCIRIISIRRRRY